jgi:serine O-acetyltransferase
MWQWENREMKALLKGVVLVLSSVRLAPHLAVMLLSCNRSLIFADSARWSKICHLGTSEGTAQSVILFLKLMTFFREYRNVFYFRTGIPGRVFSILCRPLWGLSLNSKKIGPGLFIQHGYNTSISADEIGENCWISQQVTIGYTNDTDRPTIGKNVTIHAGARIIGKVTIGDNSKVGANSVVTRDVPPDVTVMGVPAGIVWRGNAR